MVSKAHFPKFRVSAHPGQQQSVLAVVFHSIHAAAIRCKQLPGRGNYRAREYWFQMHRSDIAREACLGGYGETAPENASRRKSNSISLKQNTSERRTLAISQTQKYACNIFAAAVVVVVVVAVWVFHVTQTAMGRNTTTTAR